MSDTRRWQWFLLAGLVLLLDQLSKYWISANFYYGERMPVTDFFNLVLVHNTGAAFSFLSDAGGWQRWFFALLAGGVSIFLAAWIFRLPSEKKMLGAGLALVLGGALGNLWDRLAHGYVVDFLDFYLGQNHWPAFNIADSAITVGVILLLVETFLAESTSE